LHRSEEEMKGAREYIVVAGVRSTFEALGSAARDRRLPIVIGDVELT
jgi:hypothetical protein